MLGHVLTPRAWTALLGLGLLFGAASCAPGTDGILIADASAEEIVEEVIADGPPIMVELPGIPVVRLPALSSTAGEYDQLLQERLGTLSAGSLEGVEVVDVECQDGDIIYSGDESSDIFADVRLSHGESFSFEIAEDGSATYERERIGNRTSIRTFADGAGQFIEEGPAFSISIDVAADGSGEYYSKRNLEVTTVRAAADGSGEFYRADLTDLLTIRLLSDGGGQLFSETEDQKITIDARRDGSGEMYYEDDERVVTVLVAPDGSWEVLDRSFGHSVSVLVNPDRSGQYRERGTGRALTVDFDADGVTAQGPDIVLPPTPSFAVADRFPRLGTLASITPPCATVVRFDSALFFEVNKSDLLPEARSLLAEVAPALIEADRAIEINGHTDATGTDEYNLDLSERRAQAVANELRALGVSVDLTVQGFGESQPIAPNYRDDGSDDPAGQSQNRRVELVISG